MPTFEPQETPELCADCHHPKDDPTMHLDASGANWGSAMHWFRAAEPQPEMPQLVIGKPCPTCGREVRPPFGPGDYSCAACGFGMVEPCEHWKNAEGGTEELEETDTASPSRAIPEAEPTIYVASRASLPERPAMWRRFRDAGAPIISSWIDESGDGETASFSELWERIEAEIRSASLLILYVEAEDLPLKGALIEVGMALAMGKPVAIVAPGITLEPRTFKPIGSWTKHPRVTFYASVEAILRTLEKKA